jgi:predicted GNAT family acetyltransferase
MDELPVQVVDNKQQMQFEVFLNADLAYLQYRFYKDEIALMHTFVPDSLAGKGLASALAHYALESAKENKRKVMVYCPFVAAYLKRHPEYNNIIDKQYQ